MASKKALRRAMRDRPLGSTPCNSQLQPSRLNDPNSDHTHIRENARRLHQIRSHIMTDAELMLTPEGTYEVLLEDYSAGVTRGRRPYIQVFGRPTETFHRHRRLGLTIGSEAMAQRLAKACGVEPITYHESINHMQAVRTKVPETVCACMGHKLLIEVRHKTFMGETGPLTALRTYIHEKVSPSPGECL